MKTIATMAVLLGAVAVGLAPAADAHDRDARRADRGWNLVRTGSDSSTYPLRARRARAIRGLAFRLEHASDVLRRDARRAAGRVDRHEARALRAIHRLEGATDRFRREAQRRGPFSRRELRRELHGVAVAFRDVRSRAGASGSFGELRRDLGRVHRLIGDLDDLLVPPRRLAWGHRGWWLAQR